jgi:hypothetical protein
MFPEVWNVGSARGSRCLWGHELVSSGCPGIIHVIWYNTVACILKVEDGIIRFLNAKEI